MPNYYEDYSSSYEYDLYSYEDEYNSYYGDNQENIKIYYLLSIIQPLISNISNDSINNIKSFFVNHDLILLAIKYKNMNFFKLYPNIVDAEKIYYAIENNFIELIEYRCDLIPENIIDLVMISQIDCFKISPEILNYIFELRPDLLKPTKFTSRLIFFLLKKKHFKLVHMRLDLLEEFQIKTAILISCEKAEDKLEYLNIVELRPDLLTTESISYALALHYFNIIALRPDLLTKNMITHALQYDRTHKIQKAIDNNIIPFDSLS
jgi:hypothetical protein